uniref:CCHC-type domain-containing protein n=1 Tax=Fagus sylvatica TaxID=28930 RepID=A0A2N9I0J6_FAGSY
MGDTTSTNTVASASPHLCFTDPNHQLFIHHGDHPGVVLVSQPLTETNYHTWSLSMVMALSAKNKLGFINGTITKPAASAKVELEQWIRCNDMIKSWLLNSISPDIYSSVIYCDLASEIWTDLKERFSQVNGPRLFELEQSIHNLVQDTMSVTTYFTKLKSLWEELSALRTIPICTCGSSKEIIQYQHYQRFIKFLMGLNDSYGPTRSQILLMDPLPSVNRAYALILQEERQRNISHATPLPRSAALAAMGRPSQSNMKLSTRTKEKLKCNHCGREGHTMERCYKLHGYPTDSRNAKPKSRAHQVSSGDIVGSSGNLPFTPDQCQQLLSILSTVAQSSSMNQHAGSHPTSTNLSGMHSFDNSLWILDSGATDHMVRSPLALSHSFPVHNRTVQLPDDTHAPVTHIGSIIFSRHLTLTDVLCDLRSMKMIGMGTERDGLYYFNKTKEAHCNLTTRSTSQLWHRRLGHLSNKSAPLLPLLLLPLSATLPLPVETPPNSSPAPPRRSSRTIRPPAYLHDFHLGPALPTRPIPSSDSALVRSSGTSHPLSNFLSYDGLSPSHRAFTSSISLETEPKSFLQAMKHPKWRNANSEIDALEANHTWTLTASPPNKKPIGCKWVL